MKHIILYILFFVCWQNTKAQNLDVSLSKINKECKSGSANITINSAALPITIIWSNGSVLNEIENLESGNYSVTITADNFQDTTINFTIEELICEPIPSNHFTPNGDLYNDTWSISRLEYFPDFELLVYNRWGQQVHRQANTYIPWDGTSLGLPLADASYYYILFFSKSDKNKFIKGDISILR